MIEGNMIDKAGEPLTLMERMDALEKRVKTLEKALLKAFGNRWMDQQLKGDDEPAG